MTQFLMVSQLDLEAMFKKFTDQHSKQPALPERLNDEQAAEFLGCKISYLAQLRFKKAIPYLKAGKFITYLRSDLEAYLERVPSKAEKSKKSITSQFSK